MSLGLLGDEYERARICLPGQIHGGFQAQNSTTDADAHLLRLVLAVQANPKHVLASFDVSNKRNCPRMFSCTQPAPLNLYNLDLSSLVLSINVRKRAMD